MSAECSKCGAEIWDECYECKLEKQLAEKEKTIEKLRECLEFYADINNDDGYSARQCLKEIEGE